MIDSKASTIGMTDAAMAPKTSARIISAIGMPKASPVWRSFWDASSKSLPMLALPAMDRPKPSAPSDLTMSSTWSMLSLASSQVPAMAKGRMVMCRSAETSDSSPLW
jgi:hypothetical protein